jgi:hypothetical protein
MSLSTHPNHPLIWTHEQWTCTKNGQFYQSFIKPVITLSSWQLLVISPPRIAQHPNPHIIRVFVKLQVPFRLSKPYPLFPLTNSNWSLFSVSTHISLSICLTFRLSINSSFCPSLCIFVCLLVCVSTCHISAHLSLSVYKERGIRLNIL